MRSFLRLRFSSISAGLFLVELALTELCFDACNHFTVGSDFGGIVERGDCVVDLLLAIFFLHLSEVLFEIGCAKLFDFVFFDCLHVLGGIVVACYDKFGDYREFLRSKAECFFCDIVAHAFDFDDDASGSNGSDISFGVTFTFTHTHCGGFFGDGLIGEDADPDLTLALHITCDCDTGGFDLATGDPFGFAGLDAE